MDLVTTILIIESFLRQVVILCAGWHEVKKYIPIKAMTSHELNDLLKEISGYMARILAVIRHSGLDLPVTQDTEEAQQLLRQMEDVSDGGWWRWFVGVKLGLEERG